MKTNKSLLIKFLTIVSALCLSMAMVFGLVGCGEDARSIVKSEIIDGKLVVTYSDNTTETLGSVVGAQGAQGGTLATGCSHEFVKNVYKFATCTQKGTDIEICVKCKGYKVVESDLDANNHGVYEWTEIEGYDQNGNPATYKVLEFKSTIKTLPQDSFEAANGACPEKECTACQKPIAQHNYAWVPADVNANACENEYLELYACQDCNASVSDSRVSPANGHKYNPETATYAKVGSEYKVTLHCDECNEPTVITAEFVSEQKANCGQGGFKVYKYTYNNFDFMTNPPAAENKTVEFKPVGEVTDKTNEHKLGSLAIAQNSYVDYTPENTEELNALIAAGKINVAEGAALTCNTYKVAGFYCELCSTAEKQVLITFNLSGEHDYETIQPANCLTDGYYNCKNCGHDEYPDSLQAKGHKYIYVADSIDTVAKTIQVKCSCGDIKTTAIDNGTLYTAQTCKEKSKMTYTTTELTNGLLPGDVNYATVSISVVVELDEQKAHTLANTYKYKQGQYVDYLDAFDALVANGTINVTEGAELACNSYRQAGFTCTECKSLVVINLSGKHDFTGNQEVAGTVDCVNRVANTTKCNDCGDVITSYTGGKGHTLVADEGDWTAFMANPASNKTVNFACACGFDVDLTAVVTTRQENNVCVVTDVTVYTFTYNYNVKDANNENVAKAFSKVQEFGVSVGKHTIGLDKDGVAVKVQQGAVVEYNTVEDVINNIQWTEGEPGTCSEHKIAGFFCTECKSLITIQLSGNHDIANAELKTVDSTCDEEGYTYKVCATDPSHIIKLSVIEAKGHEVDYVVTGNSALTNETIIPGKAVGTCKRAGCTTPAVEVEGAIVEGSLELATCMKAGKVTIEYKNAAGEDVVDPITMTIPKVAQHKLHTEGNPIEVKYDANGDGKLELYYFCEDCKGYVFVKELDD